MKNTALQFDHVFSFINSNQVSEIDSLIKSCGFTLWPGRVHEGQGTENRIIGFRQNYLEFIWERDVNEINSALIKPTHLAKRAHWQKTGFSPFGIGLRGQNPQLENLPSWQYQPPYLSDSGLAITVFELPDPRLPMLFFFPLGQPLVNLWGEESEFLKHDLLQTEGIVQIEMTVPEIIQKEMELSNWEKVKAIFEQFKIKLISGSGHSMKLMLQTNAPFCCDFSNVCPVSVGGIV